MSDHLYVGTRKGLFVFTRHAAGSPPWQPAGVHFLGEPVSALLPDARDRSLYVALNLGHFGVKLHRARGNQGWEEIPAPAYPPQPAATDDGLPPDCPWSLVQLWTLEAGGADQPGVLWAGTIPGGLFRSDDGGDSWALVRALWDRPERRRWLGGGYDYPGLHSICVDPRDSRRLTIAVSSGGLHRSTDGGASWTPCTNGLHADYMPAELRDDPEVQDVHRVAHCAAAPDTLWLQHHCGIFRSTDGAARWQALRAEPSSFGFAVAAHPQTPDTAWFVPAARDDCRVPVDAHLVVTRTRDGGRSFERLDHGLPKAPTYDLIYRHGLAVDDSGERLAMGSTTGALWISDNGGEAWSCLSAHLPPINCVRFAA